LKWGRSPSQVLTKRRSMSGVHLFPRRKAGDNVFPEKGRLPVTVDQQTIAHYFGMPQPAACKALAISLTALKQVCRKLGIARWPYQRPCKSGKRYRARTASACGSPAQHAISIVDSSVNPDPAPAPVSKSPAQDVLEEERAEKEDDMWMADLADSCSSASTLAVDTSPRHWDTTASIACIHNVSHQEAQAGKLHAHDDDLGWLVGGDDDLDPPAENETFEMAWCERYCLEVQRLERVRAGSQYACPALVSAYSGAQELALVEPFAPVA